jgi:predicted Rossmann fold nucleotide-binding protein DprA/Smf involved in DNA uptake
MEIEIKYLTPEEPDYPPALLSAGIFTPPPLIAYIGKLALLKERKTALFCSVKCPGNAIIRTLDYALKIRDEGKILISGFHSPVEKECLNIYLRGNAPVIICPARGLEEMLIKKEWKKAVKAGKMLILSPFAAEERRLKRDLAWKRNLFAAALAEKVAIGYAGKGSGTERLGEAIKSWGKEVILI